MAKQTKLASPPITEAVFDLRTRFEKAPTPELLKEVGARINTDYPQQQTRYQTGFQLQISPEKPEAKHFQNIDGYIYKNAENTQAVQCKVDGFAFSRLPPYENWEPALNEALRTWAMYREITRPNRVVRIATRFINRIELPAVSVDLDDYFLVAPKLPADLPQNLSAFSVTMNIPEVMPKTLGSMRVVYDSATSATVVILDIDIIGERDLDPHDDDGLRAAIQELRPIKNRAFFGSLTEKTVELYK